MTPMTGETMQPTQPHGASFRRPESPTEPEWQARKIDSLSLMAGRVAHDFNNLLMTILGNTDLALSTVGGMLPELRGYLDEIHGASERAADLCRRLIAFSGKGRAGLQVVRLNQQITRMREILELAAGERASVVCHLADGLPPTLGNAEELQQLLIELVRNAGEAMTGSTGTIHVTTGEAGFGDPMLEVALGCPLQPQRRYLFIDVSDDGDGMDLETRLSVFDPFFTTKGPGRGLGLSRVFGAVRAHAGRVYVDSDPGAGTRMRVYLLLAEDVDD
jgi:two-component system, cell cycle sensor histidine kinase and response regulator CckA